MAQDHRLPQQRFELKYLIPEGLTLPIRDFVRGHLELDDYAARQPSYSYPVHSIYLDSDDLAIHYAGINGVRNRFKLRLRYYDDHPATPVFFEIKRRANDCIVKQRCGVRREAVSRLLAGQLPGAGDLLAAEARHLATMQRFNLLMSQLSARPKLHNHYFREAWVSPNSNSTRLTFDRGIQAEPFFERHAVLAMNQPVQLFDDLVVLELKFNTRFPAWFAKLVQRFDLMQFSSAKYCDAVELLGPHRFRDGSLPAPWPEAALQPAPAQRPASLAAAIAPQAV
jgi:hypothetical protein